MKSLQGYQVNRGNKHVTHRHTWRQFVNDTKISKEDMNIPSWGDEQKPSRGKDTLQGPRGMQRIWIVRGRTEGKLVREWHETRPIVV